MKDNQKIYFTKYGPLKSIINAEFYQNDMLNHCMVEEESVLDTPYGKMIPTYSRTDVRKKYRESISFYEDGTLASIYLENREKIRTPLGTMEMELLTFYPSGKIKKLFPLYGQCSGYWTEEDEYRLAKKVTLLILGKEVRVSPLCIGFYETGAIKSLTIWPKEKLAIPTRYGEVATKFGMDFYESGKLKSVEPVFGTKLKTKWGILEPFDCKNLRLTAENNSLRFDENGRILSAKTLRGKVVVNAVIDNSIYADKYECQQQKN
jgi:hypothetical protein